jgi:hypothetical protein
MSNTVLSVVCKNTNSEDRRTDNVVRILKDECYLTAICIC